jgi:hypothetical protein
MGPYDTEIVRLHGQTNEETQRILPGRVPEPRKLCQLISDRRSLAESNQPLERWFDEPARQDLAGNLFSRLGIKTLGITVIIHLVRRRP